MKEAEYNLFDFAIPDQVEPIVSGVRQTDAEEVRLVVAQELERVKGSPDLKWDIYKRRDGAASLVFETSSKKACDALRAALDGFRRRFNVSRECKYTNDYSVSDGGIQWRHRLELEFGRFKE
jgi:hypothetical protein